MDTDITQNYQYIGSHIKDYISQDKLFTIFEEEDIKQFLKSAILSSDDYCTILQQGASEISKKDLFSYTHSANVTVKNFQDAVIVLKSMSKSMDLRVLDSVVDALSENDQKPSTQPVNKDFEESIAKLQSQLDELRNQAQAPTSAQSFTSEQRPTYTRSPKSSNASEERLVSTRSPKSSNASEERLVSTRSPKSSNASEERLVSTRSPKSSNASEERLVSTRSPKSSNASEENGRTRRSRKELADQTRGNRSGVLPPAADAQEQAAATEAMPETTEDYVARMDQLRYTEDFWGAYNLLNDLATKGNYRMLQRAIEVRLSDKKGEFGKNPLLEACEK
ncbi:hypothetical protein TVAG_056450 [Trichomonas vaginalis G3]|uniref:Uncharacterized protein n=1 Tax=Trichomonas vaginalis (strain ATCC PRA-98 / G3) TaxID=412133 RepID=A2ECK4_TRIV3|nr:spectrin binding [Trichomonas vaginalis G3]EAY09601.1 hypothetical protein TVAG_056450 [Trichomonas vaginalis G3]KAI5502113.1 spectrin binding [Trichomonas vaginalis G3]|eukprot:XP_001321824.1 hypothetical protein [Trichomonas vaginalis G3]